MLQVKTLYNDFIENQVFKVDVNSNILPLFWGGNQTQYDAYFNITDFPTGVPNHYFTVITDGVPPATSASDIVNAPSGNLVADNVQGALNELQTEVDGLEASKQDTLVSSTNIKTINGTTILGSGDLVVSGGGGSAPVFYNDGVYGGFASRYYTLRNSKDDYAGISFYQTSPTNIGSLYSVTNPFSGQTIFTPSTVTNIKINYSTLFAETYICYLIVKRVDGGGVETNTELWNSGNIVTTASSVGSIDATGLSISLLANDRLFVSTIRTATTEGVATGIALSIALYE